MEKCVDLYEERKWLLAALKYLRSIKQMHPTWGRLYAQDSHQAGARRDEDGAVRKTKRGMTQWDHTRII